MQPILSSSKGPIIVEGGVRFSREEETALNLLIRRAGGEFEGMPNYKLGWAMEDNCSTWDSSKGEYRYDPDKRTPICFHPNQASYHFLAWEPPTSSEALTQIKGEDTSKGTYNCVFHFVEKDSGHPYNLNQIRVQLVEIVIPTMKQLNEIALASRHGFQSTLRALRMKTVERIKRDEARKDAEYASFAEDLLTKDVPAFEGHAFSASGEKRRQFSDMLKPQEIIKAPALSDAVIESAKAPEVRQPSEFAFSVRARKKD